ncbi:MAG: methylenetetrahydrofolate reductase [Candidatus Omnitrophica bacterium]|nr:methylenetetrahydrofolate reductase [Candidatus Omnitrophota bacterium]
MNRFREKINNNEFVVTTEIGPPKGVDLAPILEDLKIVKGKVDAVNVTDQQSAVMRLGSVAASKALIDNGYEPICQFTCRDRNRIALQSDLLSAYSLGIENILIMTGDHPILGDHPQAKPVYDLDSVNLLNAVNSLHSGKDLAGKVLSGSPDFLVGAVVNPGADPLEPEILKMEKKINLGARFFQTQAIFDIDIFCDFLEAIKGIRKNIKILGGIVPLKSAKMARYMNANIPGVTIPEKIIDIMDNAKDVDKESIAISADIFNAIKGLCEGVHFMPVKANYLVAGILDKVAI